MSISNNAAPFQFHPAVSHMSTKNRVDRSSVSRDSDTYILDSAPWNASITTCDNNVSENVPQDSNDVGFNDQNRSYMVSDTKQHATNGKPANIEESQAEDHPNIVKGLNEDFRHQPTIVSLGNTSLPLATIEPVMAPFEYISSLPSKGVREKLISALNIWIEVSDQVLIDVKSIVGDVHNLSLMLDDIEDNSPMRRSKPATHCVFGMPQTVNSATYQIVDVISRASELGDAASLQAVIDEMKSLLIGQAHDLLWTHLVSEPTVDDYLRMVDGKTGGLFRMMSRLMIAQSKSSTKPADLDRFMTLFGRFFQVRDDYANLMSDQYTKTKGFAEDLDEGKYSFVLVHALLNADLTTRKLLQNLLMQRRAVGSAIDCHKDLIIDLLRQAGSLEFTKQALRSLHGDLVDEIRQVELATSKENPEVRDIVSALRI